MTKLLFIFAIVVAIAFAYDNRPGYGGPFALNNQGSGFKPGYDGFGYGYHSGDKYPQGMRKPQESVPTAKYRFQNQCLYGQRLRSGSRVR